MPPIGRGWSRLTNRFGQVMVNTTAQRFQSAVSPMPILQNFDFVNPSQIPWPLPPAAFTLGTGQIHIWAVPLDLLPAKLVDLASTLAPLERERGERFRFDVHRKRFIAGRGLLRAVLSQYLETEPSRLEFVYGTRGKPSLLDGAGIRFNLAHSEDLALVAVTRGGD